MKHLRLIILSFMFLSLCFACEKTYEGEDDDRAEQSGKQDYEPENGNDDDGGGISLGDVVNVSTFCNTAIYTQVWVDGYIVGAATGAGGKTRYEFEPPFSYDTAVLMADSPSADADTEIMSVCLTSCSKRIREELNLVSHPENSGKRLRVFGFQDTYLKIPGIKNIDGYDF